LRKPLAFKFITCFAAKLIDKSIAENIEQIAFINIDQVIGEACFNCLIDLALGISDFFIIERLS
jgi:hypothetical protein